MNYWILKNCWNHQIRNNEIFLDVKKAELTGISLLNDILSGYQNDRFPKWPLLYTKNDRYFATKWPLFFVFWTTVILGIPNDRYLYQNDHYIYKKMTIILGLKWCCWHRHVGDNSRWQDKMTDDDDKIRMLATCQSVINIIICQNVMLATDL